MIQEELFVKPPKEHIRSIHKDVVYVRTNNYDGRGSRILAININKERTAQQTKEIILDTIDDYFNLFRHQLRGAYECQARKHPALRTVRRLYSQEEINCRVSLQHLVNNSIDIRKAERRGLNYLQANTPQRANEHKFLLRFSSPWIEHEQGNNTRKKKGRTYKILVEQRISEQYRKFFLRYLLTADKTRTFK